MQSILNLSKTNKLILAIFAFLAVLAFGSGRVHAATLAVDSNCTLNEAIDATNNAVDGNGCVKTGTAYGTNDTINLPAGTITLSENLNSFTSGADIVVQGAGKAVTTIDANGYRGFTANAANTIDKTLNGFKIIDASPYAIDINGAHDITIDDVEVENSSFGVRIGAVHITVTNTNIHDNVATGNSVGLYLIANAVNSTDDISITVADSQVNNNSGADVDEVAGLSVAANSATAASLALTLERTTVMDNQSVGDAGVNVDYKENSAFADIRIDAVTVAGNISQPTQASSSGNPFQPAYVTGFNLGVANINPGLNLTNVTVVNNQAINEFDNHASVSGFFGLLINAPEKINFTNSTVVGNSVTQTTPSPFGSIPAFFIIGATLDGNSQPINAESGGSAQNSLIAHNTFNGNSYSCRSDFDGSALGLSGSYDLTPENLGNNMADDPKCTDYTIVPNLYDTIEHEVADNGGPVPTIKLLPGSPAINAGGQVLGITTDARGVARTGYYSVGAYQGVLGDQTQNPSSTGGASAPNTGSGHESVLSGVFALTSGFSMLIFIAKQYAKE